MEEGKVGAMDKVRKPLQGVRNIVRFNWHFYVLSAFAVAGFFSFGYYTKGSFQSMFYLCSLLIAGTTITSLLVSTYVYDLSDLYQLRWLSEFVTDQSKVVNINAGFDETSHLIKIQYPTVELVVFDFYDPLLHTEISIKRARRAYPPYPATQQITTSFLPLPDGEADVVVLMLAAHEIRKESERHVFFKEVKRVLKPSGKIFVTEHLRDTPNFLAYSIGFFHFMGKLSWEKTFMQNELVISKKVGTTPFITTYILQKDGITA